MLPVLQVGQPGRPLAADYPGVLSVGHPRFVRRGAVAIRLILQRIEIKDSESVLLPAYHCPSMVQPVVQAGATPDFYAITEDLRVTVEEISRKLSPRTRAVLVPHFFGRLQDLRALRSLCDERRVILIEDCAHAMFGEVGGRQVGSVGHYAIASPRKFVWLPEGGVLTSATDPLEGIPVARTSVLRSLRLIYDAIDVSASCGRLESVRPVVSAIKRARKSVRRKGGGGEASAAVKVDVQQTPSTAIIDSGLQPVSWGFQSLTSRLLTREVAQSRRENFQRLLEGVRDLPGVRVPMLAPPDGTLAYALPLILPDPASQFPRLKERGIPMWRWEHSRMGVCRITDWYAAALVQLPCHQALREGDIQWMIDGVRAVVRGRP